MCVCVCVCVCERERERERDRLNAVALLWTMACRAGIQQMFSNLIAIYRAPTV